MREETKFGLIKIGQTAIGTVVILGVLVFILFVAFKYFEGWHILTALAVELALLVFLYHLYRWFRYPGLFQSKTAVQLFGRVLLSILLIYCIPVFVILTRLHIAAFLPLDKLGYKLGLEFKFKMRNIVWTTPGAPSHAGEAGRIVKIRVATENRVSPVQFKSGDVIYSLQFADGVFEIPEHFISQAG